MTCNELKVNIVSNDMLYDVHFIWYPKFSFYLISLAFKKKKM